MSLRQVRRAMAADRVCDRARVLLQTLKGGIERGELKLSGSDDMCRFAAAALEELGAAVRAYDELKKS